MAKFKNTKPKKTYKKAKPKSQKLPRNYRSIPERLNSDEVVFFVGTLAVILAMLIVSLDLYSNYTKQKELERERTKVLREIGFWQNEIKERPDFRDAFFSLALLNYRLRSLEESRNNLNEALRIDPNFEKGRELEGILDNQ